MLGWVLLAAALVALLAAVILRKSGTVADTEEPEEGLPDDYFNEGDLDLSQAATYPVCPHCKLKMTAIHFIESKSDVVYSAGCCGTLITVTTDRV